MKKNNLGGLNKVRVTKWERKYLVENEMCRISTSHDDIPHVVPVAYIYDKGAITFVTDYGTRKYRNLEVNKNISVVVDTFDPHGENKGIVMQGKALIIERGAEFNRLYQLFYKRFKWVRENPWIEGDAPFIRINAINNVSWGLKE